MPDQTGPSWIFQMALCRSGAALRTERLKAVGASSENTSHGQALRSKTLGQCIEPETPG